MTRIDCPFWSDTPTPGAGLCDKGYFGGRPSYGTCTNMCIPNGRTGKVDPNKAQQVAMTIANAPAVRMYRWLGMEWIGTPWPKRWRVRFAGWPEYVPARGCGCMKTPKTVMLHLFGRKVAL